ncbi:hypothetical protein K449DRAFT_37642 [Hypoxylon sp. EC38]|nr:hypothetical protein K449DRAFT_37642 [Hypoxylon sp. EC38]
MCSMVLTALHIKKLPRKPWPLEKHVSIIMIDQASKKTSAMSELTEVSIGILDSSEPTEQEVDKYSWKYIGYKDFTSYVAADPDFFAVRRFGRLHTRAILTLQGHLTQLEERLDEMDKRFSLKTTKIIGSSPPVIIEATTTDKSSPNRDAYVSADNEPSGARDINNGTIRDDIPERAELISKITAKLVEYDNMLLNHCSLRNLAAAPKRNVKNIESWFLRNNGAIMEEERRFIKHHDDLVSGNKEKSSLREFFENQIILRTTALLGLFKRQMPPSMSPRDQKEVYHFSDQIIDTFGSVAVFIAAILMLIVPLWILQAMEDIRWKLAIITIFVVTCLLFLTLATLGRPFERLAATAGYSAVLVVFLQLGSEPRGP